MGVALTQRPDLYNAVVIQVPLFDMLRYTHIGAGASWIGEYGDPDDPRRARLDRSLLALPEPEAPASPIRGCSSRPRPRTTGSTRPTPARPAARLEELGYDFLYYENIDGGHAAAANLGETATRLALEFTYLSQRLMD